jgi:hypothetical protein
MLQGALVRHLAPENQGRVILVNSYWLLGLARVAGINPGLDFPAELDCSIDFSLMEDILASSMRRLVNKIICFTDYHRLQRVSPVTLPSALFDGVCHTPVHVNIRGQGLQSLRRNL